MTTKTFILGYEFDIREGEYEDFKFNKDRRIVTIKLSLEEEMKPEKVRERVDYLLNM